MNEFGRIDGVWHLNQASECLRDLMHVNEVNLGSERSGMKLSSLTLKVLSAPKGFPES